MPDEEPSRCEPSDVPPVSADGGGMCLPRQVRHDLRSSIGQVIGYSDLWLDEIEESGGVNDVEALRRDLGKLRAAGRQILDAVNEHIDPIGKRAREEGAGGE